MKSFKEYADEESFLKIYLNEFDEQQIIEDIMIAEAWYDPLKHVGKAGAGAFDASVSGLGGFGKQALRGAGNVAGGVGRTLGGLGASAFGPKDTRKWGREQLGKGLLQTGKGLGQTVASPISGLVRAGQAARDPFGKLPVGGKFKQGLGIATDVDADTPIEDEIVMPRPKRRSSGQYQRLPDKIDAPLNEIKPLVRLWKDYKKELGREGANRQEIIAQMRNVERKMKETAPNWYAQIRARQKAKK